MATTRYGILLDLDETLVRTTSIEHLRGKSDWTVASRNFSLTRLSDDVERFLDEAAKFAQLAVVTRTPRAKYAEPLLNHHRLMTRFQRIVGHEDVPVGYQKPCPDPLIEAATQLGCEPWHCVYIGDQPDDMEAAQRAGAVPIGLIWPENMRRGATMLDAEYICTSWDEVLHVIRALFAGPMERRGPRILPAALSELRWRERCLSVYEYSYLSRTPQNPHYNLVRRFKEGDHKAFLEVYKDVRAAVSMYESALRDQLGHTHVVGAPQHTVGTLKPTDNIERLCHALAEVFPWMTHLPAALMRTKEIQQSSKASENHEARPTMQTHLDSIRYVEQQLRHPEGGILLVDDVFTQGATSQACRMILQNATGCRATAGLFVARTRRPTETW